MMRLRSLILLLIAFFGLSLAARKPNKKQEATIVTKATTAETETAEPPPKNAFDQHLPDCKKGFPRLEKKTKAKAIVCPMFRFVNSE